MNKEVGWDPSQRIINAVLTLLQTKGYDSVQLREVARRAHVSLATVYKLFTTRDELILAAMEHWMATNTYPDLAPPSADEPLFDGMMRVLRHVFEPWERNPRMLEAFHRARSGPNGARLDSQGINAVLPVAGLIFGGADPEYVEDVGFVLTNMIYALIGRVADGTVQVTEVLPTMERVMRRLTTNNEPEARAAREGRTTQNAGQAFTLDPLVLAVFNRKPGAQQRRSAGESPG